MKSKIAEKVMTRICRNLLLSALALGYLPTALASTTRYVNGVSGRDTNNCDSPTAACKTIGHAIAESAAGDTVMVAAATYTENLTLGISLEIIGAGSAHTVIDGGGAGSVVHISNASAHVTLSGVTLTHGAAVYGGGIYNVGTLTLVSSSVTGNGAPTGGGIDNGGTAWINNSTVSSNQAGSEQFNGNAYGGGVANSGTMAISNSTISGNTAIHSIPSGGFLYANGGGIWNDGRLTITNSTISGNSALGFSIRGGGIPQGGGISNAGSLIIGSSTIAYNRATSGGGISGWGVTLHNVVIAHNTNGNCRGTMTSQGYNLSSDGSCDFRGPGDLNTTDPKFGLGALGNYGGPTQTIPLLSGSPAIDTGNPGGCTDALGNRLTTDQRGMPRPDREDKAGCDRGAYESQSD